MSNIRIGVVGAGTIARHHADAIRALDESITAVADIDPDARQEFAVEYDVDQTYADYETMLRETGLDAAVVAVPNALHADCAIAALEADASVLVEKPLATSHDAAMDIAAAERESAGTVMVGFCKAFNPWFEGLKRRVENGRFGSVYEIDVENVRRRGIPQLGSWFTRKDVSGGGAMIDIGVHVLHLALSLLDFPEIRNVSASSGAHFGTKDDYTYLNMWGGEPVEDPTFDVDDHTRALIHTEDGATISLHVSWASNNESRQHLRVYGDDAGATVRGQGGDVQTRLFSTDNGALSATDLDVSSADRFVEEWRYFADVVRGDREHTRNTVEEGLAVQKVIDAIYESAREQTEIAVAHP